MEKNGKPVVYSALEVANICGVVNQTAINWIKSGHLKAFKTPGGQFRVYPEDLILFMKGRDMKIPESVLSACNNGDNRMKVLIVDDDRAFNDVMAKFLSSRVDGIETFQAYDGFEAGALLMEKKPRCIVLDLDLPGVDGFGICSRIQKMEKDKPVIIVVTGMQDKESEDKCYELGVFKYTKKPVSLPDLAKDIDLIKNS